MSADAATFSSSPGDLPPTLAAVQEAVRQGRPGWALAGEWATERALALCGGVAMTFIVLIFAFLFREALPALTSERGLMQFIVAETTDTIYDPATDELRTVTSRGYVWQPISESPKVSLVPLVWGSFQIALMAAAIATVIGIAAGMFLAEMAGPEWRARLKPALELLVGIPTVVIGFFILAVLAPSLHGLVVFLFGEGAKDFYPQQLNAFVGAIGVSLLVIPVLASLVDDAMTAVDPALREASYALGSTRWQTSWRVVLPAARSGVVAATILGFGRALGETMIVLMVAGNAAQITGNPFAPVTTMTARIAAEMGSSEVGSLHRHTLFLVGAVLITMTFILNIVAESMITRHQREHAH